jgi:hypothetical protein
MGKGYLLLALNTQLRTEPKTELKLPVDCLGIMFVFNSSEAAERNSNGWSKIAEVDIETEIELGESQ